MGDRCGNFNVTPCQASGITAISHGLAPLAFPGCANHTGENVIQRSVCAAHAMRLAAFLRHLISRRQIQPLPELLVGALTRQRVTRR